MHAIELRICKKWIIDKSNIIFKTNWNSSHELSVAFVDSKFGIFRLDSDTLSDTIRIYIEVKQYWNC